jgi:hypothetical protein
VVDVGCILTKQLQDQKGFMKVQLFVFWMEKQDGRGGDVDRGRGGAAAGSQPDLWWFCLVLSHMNFEREERGERIRLSVAHDTKDQQAFALPISSHTMTCGCTRFGTFTSLLFDG